MELNQKIDLFLSQNKLTNEDFNFSSLDLVGFAVKIEKHFNIEFTLDEVTQENLGNKSALKALLIKKIN